MVGGVAPGATLSATPSSGASAVWWYCWRDLAMLWLAVVVWCDVAGNGNVLKLIPIFTFYTIEPTSNRIFTITGT